MAECKRSQHEPPVALQREKKNKELRPTLRFDLTLTEPTESSCCEFSYKDLVKNAEAQRREKLTDDLFEDEDNEEKLEEKHNPKPGRRKKKKATVCEDYVDRGMGYDETDPFIDNDEAYDELVPSTITTQFGGFYINKGDLEFKSILDGENSADPKMRKKRRKKDGGIYEKDSKRKRRVATDDENSKRRGRKSSVPLPVSALPKVKKRPQPTVADMLQQAKAQLQLQQQEKLQQIQLVPIAVERNLESEVNNEILLSTVPTVGLNSTISDAIESVIKAAAEEAVSNGSAGLVTGSSDGEEVIVKPPIESIEAPKLPENLPPDLENLVAKLKQAAYNSEEGKCKFFSEEVNRMLLSVELKSQELTSAQRSTIYSHLASHLPCTKETLQKRAKKLRLDQEDNKLREPMQKLKDAIAEVMPEMMEKYAISMQLPFEIKEDEKFDDLEMPPLTDEESPDEEERKQQIPKKKFEWNDNIRKYLCDVVRIKLKCYEVSKTRIQSAEEYLKHFLEAEVKSLWPPGWMHARTLFKESKEAHLYITNRQKKHLIFPKKTGSNPLSPAVVAVKPAISVLNSAMLSQESNHFEPASQSDRCVPSSVTLPLYSDITERKCLDSSKLSAVAAASEELRKAEFMKLLTYPIKSSFSENLFSAQSSPSAETKMNDPSVPAPSKTVSCVAPQRMTEQHLVAATQAHGKQSGHSSIKASELNTFKEGSLATDMLARIICASLADFPYAGSTNSETPTPKNQSVITSSSSLSVKDTRVVNSKLTVDTFTSPQRLDDAKLLNVESRKPSQDTVSHSHLSMSNHIESLLNAQHTTKQGDIASSSILLTKSKNTLDSVKSPVNLKLKDVMVPQPRHFAEAFERSSDHMSNRKSVTKTHSIKSSSIHVRNLSAASTSASVGFSNANELLTESSVSASTRTIIENSQRLSQELATKMTTCAITQGLTTAPYKKRSKYAQSNKNIEQWNHFVDTSLNATLLEGMKGFPFPVSTLQTPPPAHCSAPLKTTTQLKDSTYSLHNPHSPRGGSLLSSSGLRNLKDLRAESANHNQQGHARLPVLEVSRRQTLIKGPWNTNPASQASPVSHSQFLGSSQSSVANPKSTSPSVCSSTSLHNATIVYAHSHSTPPPPPEKSPVFSQSQLPSRATPSPVPGHTSRTSPSNVHLPHINQAYLVHQPSHSVSVQQPPVHSRSGSSTSYVHTHPSTPSNALTAGTFTFSQEQKADPRTN